jgi:hypothetical protein
MPVVEIGIAASLLMLGWLAGPPSAVMPPQPSSSTMVITVPAGHALEATRKVRWGAGFS